MTVRPAARDQETRDAGTLNQRWSATLVGTLRAGGVEDVVVAPGSRSTPVVLAFADRPDVRMHVVIDERVAGFLALGIARATGAPVAVVVTSGTAPGHLLPAVMEANASGVPLVILTADRPFELHGFGAPQTADQRGLFGRQVGAEVDLPAPSEPGVLHLAHLVARVLGEASRRRRPVHLNVPFGEPLAPESTLPGPVVTPALPMVSAGEHRADVSAAAGALSRAQRPLILCGPREGGDGFGEAVHALGAHLGIPVLAEAASNARYGFPGAIAMYDALWRSPGFAQAMAPDVVLRFGRGMTAKSMMGLRAPVMVHVQDDEAWFDPFHAATEVIAGKAPAVCQALIDGTRPRRAWAWHERWLAAERTVRERLDAHRELDEPTVARAVVESLPAGANLVLSSSMPIRDVDAFAPSSAGPVRVFSNRGVNGIDGVTATAAGVSVGSQRPTVLLTGDLALLHDVGAWVTLRQLGRPLVVVVVNNDGGGIFNFLPVADRTPHFERLFATPHGVDLAPVAALGGATLHRPATVDALAALLPSLVGRGLHLVEVRVPDRQVNVARHRELNAALVEGLVP